MVWKALPADDPLDQVDGTPDRPPLSVVATSGHRDAGFLSELGVGWTVVLAVLAVGAVLAAAFVWQPMMSLR